MFHALSSVMQGALAPDVPAVVDFRHHWNMFLRFYAEHKPLNHKSQPVERTYLVFHLNNMLKLLVQEQKDLGNEQVGPCLEYLIHHQVLDILSSLCQADIPPGIRPYIFKLFIFIVSKINQQILPYVSVYFPIRRLLMLSTMTKASPTENQELTFITCLLTKLKQYPELLPLFAHEARGGDISRYSSRRSSAASSMIDLTHIEQLVSPVKALLENFESSHLLVAALINLIDSADYMVSIKAMDNLLVAIGLPDDVAAQNAVRGTELVSVIAKRLQRLFDAIPGDVEVAMIEEIKVTWMEAHHFLDSKTGAKLPDFPGKSELVMFFSWIDFCDDLVMKGNELVADAVAETVRKSLFEDRLQSQLFEASSDKTVLTLALITQSWVHLRSEGLGNEYSNWLFGEGSHHELKDVVTHGLKHHLLNLCSSRDQEVTLEVLSLFDVILDRPCDPILSSLVLSNLTQRTYFNAAVAESSMTSWSDEEDEREKTQRQLNIEQLTPTSRRTRQKSPSDSNLVMSRTMAPSNIARVINAWLYMVPDSLRSSDAAKDSGYEQYVKNAQGQVAAVFKKCEGFSWPQEAIFAPERTDSASSDSAVVSDIMSSDSKTEGQDSRGFYEGAFLATMFDMLESLLDRDYDVNLQLTSILSKLCQLPHPHLHEFLLNPTIPLVPGTRTLYSTMQHVLERIKEETDGIDQLQRKIYMCRKTLMGSRHDREALNLTLKETKVIDGLIILEEFSKEIAAITLVKYHHSCG